jgi:hypothetical protein
MEKDATSPETTAVRNEGILIHKEVVTQVSS